MDKIKYCANCKHWYIYNESDMDKYGEGASGECRRYPPSVPNFAIEGNNNGDVPFDELCIALIKGTPLMSCPFTFADGACGEFRPMDNPRWHDSWNEDEVVF